MMITQDVSDTHRRTSRGAGGGLQPPTFGQFDFFGAMTKIWAEGPGSGFWREKKYFLQIKNIF